MPVLYLLLLIAAALCFLGAAVNVPAKRVGLVALGLFFWVLVAVIRAGAAQ